MAWLKSFIGSATDEVAETCTNSASTTILSVSSIQHFSALDQAENPSSFLEIRKAKKLDSLQKPVDVIHNKDRQITQVLKQGQSEFGLS